jgi:hypothetical protein
MNPRLSKSLHDINHRNYVYVEVLSSLYELLVSLMLNGQVFLSNKQGIFFGESGHVSWR